MIRRILLALSGNPFSESAIETALAMARRNGGEVTALAVYDRNRVESVGAVPVGAGRAARELRDHRRESVLAAIAADVEKAESRCGAEEVPLRILREEADALERLDELSRTHDLVVLGLRGFFDYGVYRKPETVVVRLLAGGIHPILAVAERPRPVERVLLAVNGSRESARAMKELLQLRPWERLHVKAVCFGSAVDGPALLREVSAYLQAHGLDVETEHRSGSPRGGLVAHAGEWGADAIVLGATSRSNLAREIFGDTALEALRTAEIPLFLSC